MDGCQSKACRGKEDTLKFNKTHTKFIFLRPSPDESIVGVVYSFPAGTMGGGAE
jgi:hypothetical protein